MNIDNGLPGLTKTKIFIQIITTLYEFWKYKLYHQYKMYFLVGDFEIIYSRKYASLPLRIKIWKTLILVDTLNKNRA